MDLTMAWHRIEALVESLQPFIETVENGNEKDYARAVREIRKRTSEIEQLSHLAAHLSQKVSDRMQPPSEKVKAVQNVVKQAQMVGARTDQTRPHTPIQTEEHSLIDLTVEDIDEECSEQHAAKRRRV